MTTADTTPDSSGNPAAAAGELSIPKYRLDEVSSELRRLREEMSMKDRLYMEERQRMLAQTQQTRQAPELTPEDTGLDPQTHSAVLKAARMIARKEIDQEKSIIEQQLGMLATRTEKAELLASRGADKEKYLPDIQRRQQAHFQSTGGFLPAEMALKLILADEKDAKIRELEARLSVQAPATSVTPGPNPVQGGLPNAAATRQMPASGTASGVGASGTKSFSELSVEEMEARLQEQFSAGNVL